MPGVFGRLRARRLALAGALALTASLLLRLEVVCKSPQEAEDLEQSLRGLNSLAASIAGAASGPDNPGAWAGMLRSARFEVQAASVVGVWSVDPALLSGSIG